MRFVHPIARAAALGMAALFASISPTWANLVTNPGFEECLDVGQTPPPGWTGTASCGGRPGGGADPDMGFFSAIFDASVTLSQSFATSAGDKYEFSFWLFNTNPIAIPHAFTAAFGPDMVLNLGSNVDTFPYTFYDFTVSATAASDHDQLRILRTNRGCLVSRRCFGDAGSHGCGTGARDPLPVRRSAQSFPSDAPDVLAPYTTLAAAQHRRQNDM